MDVNLKNEYHDSGITGFVFPDDHSVVLFVNLDGCWNSVDNPSVQLIFHNVCNLEDVKKHLGRAAASDLDRNTGYRACELDWISCICRTKPKGFDLHLIEYGKIFIDAERCSEGIQPEHLA